MGASCCRMKLAILLTKRASVLASEPVDIIQPDVLDIEVDESAFLQPGERATDGFQFQPQITPDFLARHAQIKIRGGNSLAWQSKVAQKSKKVRVFAKARDRVYCCA